MMVFGDGTFGHTGTIENTHAMVLDRPDGVTWSVLVSGEYPGTTGNLRQIFDEAAARRRRAAGLTVGVAQLTWRVWPSQNGARSLNFCSLPVAVRSRTSRNSTRFGHL